MYLLSAGSFFTGKLIQALCWMLVHSLWEGLLLAGLTALIIVFTRQRSAALRYNLITSALVLFITAISITFYLQVNRSFSETTTLEQNAGHTSLATPATVIITPATLNNTSFISSFTNFFNKYATAIVFIWFLVIGVKLAKMAAGLYGIQQLKKRKVSSVGSYWSLRVQQLSAQLNINSQVQFLQSGIVKVPMVIGYFKPIIFFPLGALASLPPADVEAILMHELAHIRRKDYLVNMLQHLVEILFFFNPAVLWVSALIKTERENCCDDIALAQTNNKRDYINALVSFQEFDEAQPRYATALTGKKDHLLQRVKRIINNNNKSLNNMEKVFLIGCFLLTGTLTLVFSQTAKNKPATETSVQKKETTKTAEKLEETFDGTSESAQQIAAIMEEGTTIVYSDHAAKPRKHFVSKRDGNIYEIYGDITWFKINGKEIPQKNWDKYKSVMDDMMSNNHEIEPEIENFNLLDTPKNAKQLAELAALKQQQQKMAEEQKMLMSQHEKLAEEQKKVMMIDSLNAGIDSKRTKERKATLDQQQKILDEQIKEIELQKKLIEEDKERAELRKRKEKKEVTQTNANKNINRNVNIERVEDNDKYLILTGLSYSTNSNISNKVNVTPAVAVDAKDIDVEALTNNIIADLKINNIISDVKDLSYQLTNEQLIVNEKVQPEAIHSKLKAKYIKSPDWKLLYNWKQKSN